jgi:hypothetical protein
MKGIWIGGDQLIEDNPLIQNSPRAPLIMIEYTGFSLSRTYHKKKADSRVVCDAPLCRKTSKKRRRFNLHKGHRNGKTH